MRIEWERDRREQDFSLALSRLTGQYEALPSLIEATARRVFQDMFRDAQAAAVTAQQNTVRERWRRADTVILAIQAFYGIILLIVVHH